MKARSLTVLFVLGLMQCVDVDDVSRDCGDAAIVLGIHNSASATEGRWYAVLEDGWFAGSDGVRQDCPHTLYGIRCTLPHHGAYTFGARAGDRQLTVQRDVTLDKFCSPGVDVFLADACTPEEVVAVHGSLMWSEGQPVTNGDDVEVRIESKEKGSSFLRDCERVGSQYRCFAVNDTATDYTVTARMGSSILLQRVTVPISQCQVSPPVELNFVRESWPCAAPRTMPIELAIFSSDPSAPDGVRRVMPDGVKVGSALAASQPCTLIPTTEPNQTNVVCPLAGHPRDGVYRLDVEVGGRTETIETYQDDDGCEGRHNWYTLWLYDGKTCDGFDAEWCSTPGSVFPSYSRCYAYDARGPKLPPCVRPKQLP